MRAELWNNMQRVLPYKIQKEQLKLGDHIFTWREANTKHHAVTPGIYINYEKVIHFTEGAWSDSTRPNCSDRSSFHVVVYSCIDRFLSGGDLYLYEYGVNPVLFLTKLWEDSCTLASSDPPQVVKDRASFLLNDGSAADYYRYINNGKDFAIYCKTGLLVVDRIDFRRSWQTSSFLAITAVAFFDYEQQLMLAATFWGLFGRYVGIYCIRRFALDIGARPNVIKVDQAGSLPQPQVDGVLFSGTDWDKRTLESLVDSFLLFLIFAFLLCLLSTMWSEPLQVWSDTLKVVWSLPYITFFYWVVLQRRLVSNKIKEGQLKPGDHIYTWRRAYIGIYAYAHHGIYVGNGKVIHVDRGQDPISSGGQPRQNRVESCSLDSFLADGKLYLYKYGVTLAFFMVKTRGGTCTYLSSDPTEDVLKRAKSLLEDEKFGAYNMFNNNCEDFAIYCKTSLLSTIKFDSPGTNGQTSSIMAIYLAYRYLKMIIIPTSYFKDRAVTAYFVYSMLRYAADKGRKVPLEELEVVIQPRIRNFHNLIQCFIYLLFCVIGFMVVDIIAAVIS